MKVRRGQRFQINVLFHIQSPCQKNLPNRIPQTGLSCDFTTRAKGFGERFHIKGGRFRMIFHMRVPCKVGHGGSNFEHVQRFQTNTGSKVPDTGSTKCSIVGARTISARVLSCIALSEIGVTLLPPFLPSHHPPPCGFKHSYHSSYAADFPPAPVVSNARATWFCPRLFQSLPRL